MTSKTKKTTAELAKLMKTWRANVNRREAAKRLAASKTKKH